MVLIGELVGHSKRVNPWIGLGEGEGDVGLPVTVVAVSYRRATLAS